MADVFVSYVSEDRAIAEQISRGLEGAGFSVWWDRHIHGGVDFATEIERQLSAAKIVVVLWSKASLDSKWVRDEAQQARDDNKLIPVRLDSVQPPLGFRQVQCLDFGAWKGNAKELTFVDLVDSIRRFVGSTPSDAVSPSTAAAAAQTRFRASTPTRRWSRIALIALAGVCLLVVAIGIAWRYVGTTRSVVSELPPIRSLAVLPLENLSGDPEQTYFADGMTETLVTELAKLTDLRVISRTSVIRYKASHRPVRDIARELDVDGVIQGSVLRSGERVRITAQLIDARSDRHVWADSYDRDVARVLEIQSEVARAVAAAIKLALSPDQVARFATKKAVDPRAQEAYYRGIAARERPSGQELNGQIDFDEASAIAPDYAAPRASWAATAYMEMDYTMVPSSQLLPERESLRMAKGAAQQAVELDDGLGDAHVALGLAHYLYDWNWEAAERELRRGHELGASDPVLRAMAPGFFFVTGRPTEALGWMREAVAAAPHDAFVRTRQAELSRALGHYRKALTEVNALLAATPGHAPGGMQQLYAMESLRDIDGLRNVYQRFPAHQVDGFSDWFPVFVETGGRILQSEGPAAWWRFCAQTNLTDHYFDPVRAAKDFVRAGDHDAAFDALEQAYRLKASAILWVPQSAEFAPLRQDPRFADLAQRLNLPVPAS